MEKISENLERYHKAFINEDQIFGFFTGLGDYSGYVFEENHLHRIVEKTFHKKRDMYDKLAELETQASEELQKVRNKLLKIVADNKIDPTTLKDVHSTTPFSTGVLNNLERFENGQVRDGGYRTDSLESYLSDIAVSIYQLGFHNELKEFINPKTFSRNIYGHFELSPTLLLSHQYRENIERSRTMEMWGVFDQLQKFHYAFFEVAQNTPWGDVGEKYVTEANSHLEVKDAVDISMLAGEWGEVVKANTHTFPRTYGHKELHRLVVSIFRKNANRAHAYLLKELQPSPLIEAQTKALERALDEGLKEEALTEKILSKVSERYQPNGKERSPISLSAHLVEFVDGESLLRFNGDNCPLPPYKSEHYLCRVMFNPEHPVRTAVDWSVVFEEMEGLPQRRKQPQNDMRSLQDAMYALNKRVKETFNTADDLFSWRNKSVVRNF